MDSVFERAVELLWRRPPCRWVDRTSYHGCQTHGCGRPSEKRLVDGWDKAMHAPFCAACARRASVEAERRAAVLEAESAAWDAAHAAERAERDAAWRAELAKLEEVTA
ncbi:MAG: hypothetical protein LBK54_01625 [Propionibacteriaceae bacterium]|nr:hypothetical protein [Propionibacteriaceae bacterium]